jgi:hypothetical protein
MFAGRLDDQDGRMTIESLDYAQLSEDAMAAADRAPTLDECQTHLHRAVRYAQLACLERPRQSNVVELRSGARREP